MSSTGNKERPGGLSRARLVEAGLGLVQSEGLAGLTMRRLADELGVKAASLYWHVRDRGELTELLATSLLEDVRLPRAGTSWRQDALAVCGALAAAATRTRDGGRIL